MHEHECFHGPPLSCTTSSVSPWIGWSFRSQDGFEHMTQSSSTSPCIALRFHDLWINLQATKWSHDRLFYMSHGNAGHVCFTMHPSAISLQPAKTSGRVVLALVGDGWGACVKTLLRKRRAQACVGLVMTHSISRCWMSCSQRRHCFKTQTCDHRFEVFSNWSHCHLIYFFQL